jgi:hypothetical protein
LSVADPLNLIQIMLAKGGSFLDGVAPAPKQYVERRYRELMGQRSDRSKRYSPFEEMLGVLLRMEVQFTGAVE